MPSKTHDSSLTDAEWTLLQSIWPTGSVRGTPATWPRQLILDAIFCVLRGGIIWRALPQEFPPCKAVFYHFRQMRLSGLWEKVNTLLRRQYRVRVGRTSDAHAAVIDSQSAKTTEVGGERGVDGNKKIKGRKRHILVDTLGLRLKVVVHPAGLQNRQGGRLLVEAIKGQFPTLTKIWADQGYTGTSRT